MTKSAKLIICPTPIGNLGDMPPRALEALRGADVVCAEDTRVTGRLLAAFGVEKRLERLDEATISHAAARVVGRVLAGETVAYCSDAGMPGVSDPGQRLVDAALDAGAAVEVLPGPTAVATAYVASGFPCPRFYFGGFFPRKAGERASALEALRGLDAVALFYESPNRIASALSAVAEALPYRRVAVCRELTKIHEEVVRGPVAEVRDEFARRQESGGVKGEIVLVLDAPSEDERAAAGQDLSVSAEARAAELRAEGGHTAKDIVRALRAEFGISRNEAYELATRA